MMDDAPSTAMNAQEYFVTLQPSGQHGRAQIAFLAAAGCAACLLVGCSTPVARSVVNANLAQEQAANQLLLLNIARAHERMPMHFSQMGQIRSAPGGWGLGVPSLSFEIPFGGPADNYKLTAANEGQSPVDVTAIYSQEFMRGLTTPMSPVAMAYFANQGWSTPLLMHLFFESIATVDEKGTVLERLRNDPGSADYSGFRDFVERLSGCDLAADLEDSAPDYLSSLVDSVSVADGVEVGNAKLRLREVPALTSATANSAPKAAAPAAAQAASTTGYRLAAVSQDVVLRLRPPPLMRKAVAERGATAPGVRDAYAPCMTESLSAATLDETSTGGSPAPPTPPASVPPIAAPPMTLYQALTSRVGHGAPLRGRPDAVSSSNALAAALTSRRAVTQQFVLRSPGSMLYYLGQLSRAQNGGWLTTNNNVPLLTIPLADGSRGVLFNMSSRSSLSPAAIAVQVEYADKTFSVARPDYRSGEQPGGKAVGTTHDRSTTTLSLVQLILGLQDKGSEAPGVSNVRLLR